MGLFRRRSRSDAATAAAQVTAITEFWSWWQATGSEQVARAIADGTAESVSSLIDERVKGIDPGLSWELGPGTWPSRHRLMVTPEGNPALRATAHRWLRAAPAAGEVWCYADSRHPLSDLEGTTLQVDGVRITPSEVQVAAPAGPCRRSGCRSPGSLSVSGPGTANPLFSVQISRLTGSVPGPERQTR